MTIEKKETELTEFLKSIPEDPMAGGDVGRGACRHHRL